MNTGKPKWTRWKRRAGGRKICPECDHKHKPTMRIAGKAQRPRMCVKCGAELPSRLTYPNSKKGGKTAAKWYIRQTDPNGAVRDFPCRSSEEADELARKLERDWTADPIQEGLIEYTSALIRRIEASDQESAITELIVKLGGDASARTLTRIDWDEAREIVADELRQTGKSWRYVDDMLRITTDLRAVTGVQEWSEVSLETIAKYRGARMKGGGHRSTRPMRPVGGRSINRELSTLSAFLTRAAEKNWIIKNPLKGAARQRVKVKKIRVPYMPDQDLEALIAGAEPVWFKVFLVVSYYTGARRDDVLRLEWETDVDLDGSTVAPLGRSGPHIYIQGTKNDEQHWMPLHPVAVQALQAFRREPVIDRKVFPLRGVRGPGDKVSRLFAKLCVQIGLTETVERDGKAVVKNKWTHKILRKKAETDLRNTGASPKERAALLGRRSVAVGETHYEALLPSRERDLIDGLPVFGMTA